MMNSLKQSNTITALVIAAMEPNWARHYLKGVGMLAALARITCLELTEGTRISGDIKYVRYILDIMS